MAIREKEPRAVNKLAGQTVRKNRNLLIVLILGGISFLANYSLSPFFGIYEDDYMFFLPVQSWNFAQLFICLKGCLLAAPQARPLGGMLSVLVAYLSRGGNLTVAYMIGWMIITCNAVLLYFILGRVIARPAAFVGAVTYLLLPVDLSKQILMLRGYVHFSMLFLLLALILYLGGTPRRKAVSYLVAALSLVTWEAFYLPFLVAPLLEVNPVRDKIRNFLIHLVIFPVPVLVTLLVRYLMGERRVSEMAGGGAGMLSKMLASTVIGPSTAAAAFFWRPLEALHYADASAKIVGVFGAVLVAFALIKLTRPSVDFPNRTAVFRLGVCALISMTLPYVLMYRFYYYPPNMSIGLVSVCHSAGAFGYSLAAACIAAGLLKAWRYRIELWGVVIAAYFGILVVFGYHIQETEYVEGWNAQKLIWQRVISQCGDVSDGDTILVNLSGLPCSQMFSAAWIGSAGSGALSKFVEFRPPGLASRRSTNIFRPIITRNVASRSSYNRLGGRLANGQLSRMVTLSFFNMLTEICAGSIPRYRCSERQWSRNLNRPRLLFISTLWENKS
jgi:hypothetical protein